MDRRLCQATAYAYRGTYPGGTDNATGDRYGRSDRHAHHHTHHCPAGNGDVGADGDRGAPHSDSHDRSHGKGCRDRDTDRGAPHSDS
jgi:hypothetical protein